MKKMILAVIIIGAIAEQIANPAFALLGFSGKSAREACNISVSPTIIDYGDISQHMVDNPSLMNRKFNLSVICTEDKKIRIAQSRKSTGQKGANIITSIDNVLENGEKEVITVLHGNLPISYSLENPYSNVAWEMGNVFGSKNKTSTLSAEITVLLELPQEIKQSRSEFIIDEVINFYIM